MDSRSGYAGYCWVAYSGSMHGPSWDHLWIKVILGPSCDNPGVILGHPWNHPKPSWDHLGPCWQSGTAVWILGGIQCGLRNVLSKCNLPVPSLVLEVDSCAFGFTGFGSTSPGGLRCVWVYEVGVSSPQGDGGEDRVGPLPSPLPPPPITQPQTPVGTLSHLPHLEHCSETRF